MDLVFVGPLTDLARALDQDPTIEENIGKLYWMGGTFLDIGNVEDPEHDGTAELERVLGSICVKTSLGIRHPNRTCGA